MPLSKGSGSTARALSFSAICRDFSSGGTRIRTGDTMIFRHIQKPLGMRQILIGRRIYVHRVPLDTSWFCPYCCATVDTALVTLQRHRKQNAYVSARLTRLLVTPALRYPSERHMYRGATTKRYVRAASSPSPPLLALRSVHRGRPPHATARRSSKKRADERTRTADLLITSDNRCVAGTWTGLRIPHV